MISELCIEQGEFAELQRRMLASDVEQCAVLLAAIADRPRGRGRLLVRETVFPDEGSYQIQSSHSAQLTPDFVAKIAKRAKLQRLRIVFVHTHPGDLPPDFSRVDDAGELALRDFLLVREVQGPHAALVLSAGGLRCRILGDERHIRVLTLGAKRTIEFDPQVGSGQSGASLFDRQVRAFGAPGQRRLESLCVAIVGLGGTGSIVAQQLVHLGVSNFILVDPDVIEETNLNRIVGANVSDVGKAKVDIAMRYVQEFRPGVTANTVLGNVAYDRVARELVDADLIMCCTDSHGSRAVIQQVAYQYMIPCVDMGSTITQSDGEITGIFGRVQLLGPGLPCLWCGHLLDPTQVRRDMANDAERRLDPYIVGGEEPAPSVISLNGTVVSLAVSMVLSVVAEAPIHARHLIYNASSSTLRSVRTKAASNCFICSREGAYGWGDQRALFTRQD